MVLERAPWFRFGMSDALLPATAATATVVIALLIAERQRRGTWIAKPLASLGFVAVAWLAGALQSSYGQAVLVGLVLCALGDVLLLPRGAGPAFLAGMASFALGHAAYGCAFWLRGAEPTATAITLSTMGGVAFLTLRWLDPRLPDEMRVPIRAYISVISVMVALAVGTSTAGGDPRPAIGAIAFAISDLSVARERFVHPAFANLAWGLPLYYAAQLVLAWSVRA